jgi:hypothetical protein
MGQANAAALSRGSARELSEFERFAKALQDAARAWESLRGIHDDQLSDVGRFDQLATMAADAARRLAGIRALGEVATVTANEMPWRRFVGALYKGCKRVGLDPGVTGRVYEAGAKPSWFQEFVLAVNDNLLGRNGYPKHSSGAFHAETVAAVRAVK